LYFWADDRQIQFSGIIVSQHPVVYYTFGPHNDCIDATLH